MNLTEILDQSGIEFKRPGEHHHATYNFLQIDCPFCSPQSKKFRMGIHVEKLFSTCWTCGWHPFDLTLSECLSVSLQSIREISKGLTTSKHIQTRIRGNLRVPDGIKELQDVHKKYLRKRGFDPEEISIVWGVKGIGLEPNLRWRLWIPIHLEGEIVSWTTRSIYDSPSRYVTAKSEHENIPAKSILYGEDYVRNSIIIHEGPIDVWRTGPGSVATLGVNYTPDQLNRISKYPIRIICFDSDEEAQKRARKLCRDLGAFPGKTKNIILKGKDAAESSGKEIRKLREMIE